MIALSIVLVSGSAKAVSGEPEVIAIAPTAGGSAATPLPEATDAATGMRVVPSAGSSWRAAAWGRRPGDGSTRGAAVHRAHPPGTATAAPGFLRPLVGFDKLLHVTISALLVGGIYGIYHDELNNDRDDSRVVAAAGTGAIGVVKEMRDRRFSVPDLAADAAGIAIGLALLTE